MNYLNDNDELDTTGTGGLDLGDARRVARLKTVMESLAAQPTASIPLAAAGWAETKACYHLLAPEKKTKTHWKSPLFWLAKKNPPAGEKAILWRLLTNRAVETLAQASEMLDWYRRRWLIEIFFRVLKSGCRVESLQLSSVDRLERAIMIYLIIGWRILHIVTTGQACPNLPCDVVFDPEEWQAAWTVKYRQKPPPQTPKLGEMVRIIAGFGGFLGRKSDGFPGTKTLWESMEKVRHYALGIEIGRAVYASSDCVVGNRVVVNLSTD